MRRHLRKRKEEDKEPINGLEFFFAHHLVRIQQVPILFYESSEFEQKTKPHEGCFLVMIYEKIINKRQVVPIKLGFREPETQ